MTTSSLLSASATRRAAIGGTGTIAASLLLDRGTLAQNATPPAGAGFGLAPWAEQLATIDPATLGSMLIEREPIPHVNVELSTGDLTERARDGSSPLVTDALVQVVGVGATDPTTDALELGPGAFHIYESTEAARDVLASLSTEDTATESTTVAGLPGVWAIFDEVYAQLVFAAGPVLTLADDALFASMARTHLAVSVFNALGNAQHLLQHLYNATAETLGVD